MRNSVAQDRPDAERKRAVPVTLSLVAVLAVATFAAWAAQAVGLGVPGDHALEHVIAGVSTALLALLSARYWPRPTRGPFGRASRSVLTVGLSVFAVAQGLEAAGALGAEMTGRWARLGDLHGIAVWLGVIGLLLALFGALASLAVMAAARLNLEGPRWTFIAVSVPVVAVISFVVGAVVFGY